MGDKQGSDIRRAIANRGAGVDVLDRFSEFIGFPIKLIHTVRNPYDSIAARLDRRTVIKRVPDPHERFEKCVSDYEGLYRVTDLVLSRHPHLKVYNEELIANPKMVVTQMCEYLELPIVEPWFSDAVGSVFAKPHNRKDNREWLPGQKEELQARVIDKYPYFHRYREV
jgi:hypothetical protein